MTVNNIFKEMYAIGLIKNFENWVDYREKRNTQFNKYNLEKTYIITDIIPNYTIDVKFYLTNLKIY